MGLFKFDIFKCVAIVDAFLLVALLHELPVHGATTTPSKTTQHPTSPTLKPSSSTTLKPSTSTRRGSTTVHSTTAHLTTVHSIDVTSSTTAHAIVDPITASNSNHSTVNSSVSQRNSTVQSTTSESAVISLVLIIVAVIISIILLVLCLYCFWPEKAKTTSAVPKNTNKAPNEKMWRGLNQTDAPRMAHWPEGPVPSPFKDTPKRDDESGLSKYGTCIVPADPALLATLKEQGDKVEQPCKAQDNASDIPKKDDESNLSVYGTCIAPADAALLALPPFPKEEAKPENIEPPSKTMDQPVPKTQEELIPKSQEELTSSLSGTNSTAEFKIKTMSSIKSSIPEKEQKMVTSLLESIDSVPKVESQDPSKTDPVVRLEELKTNKPTTPKIAVKSAVAEVIKNAPSKDDGKSEPKTLELPVEVVLSKQNNESSGSDFKSCQSHVDSNQLTVLKTNDDLLASKTVPKAIDEQPVLPPAPFVLAELKANKPDPPKVEVKPAVPELTKVAPSNDPVKPKLKSAPVPKLVAPAPPQTKSVKSAKKVATNSSNLEAEGPNTSSLSNADSSIMSAPSSTFNHSSSLG